MCMYIHFLFFVAVDIMLISQPSSGKLMNNETMKLKVQIKLSYIKTTFSLISLPNQQ